jgi:hypothetical protein
LVVNPPASKATFIDTSLRAMDGHGFDSWPPDV